MFLMLIAKFYTSSSSLASSAQLRPEWKYLIVEKFFVSKLRTANSMTENFVDSKFLIRKVYPQGQVFSEV